MTIDNSMKAKFSVQLWVLIKRLLFRVVRRPYTELPTIIISAFFLFVYVGQLDRVFGGGLSYPLIFQMETLLILFYHSQ